MQVPSPLGRLPDHRLLLGLFLPMQQGAWSPSKAPRSTSWTFEYIARCTTMAEALGFDLVFGLAQWLGKGGYGGEMHFREHEVDPIIANAALASLTRSIVLINTVHVLYAWHPLHLAKFGAAMDHISGGRWGINVVTGYKPSEYRMFGLEPIEHDLRYAMADEFTTIMERLWSEDEELSFAGKFWRTERAFLAPKPGQRRPFLVNAASSSAGLDYAAKHSDLIFITSPAGADPALACEALPAHNARIKALAREIPARGKDDHQSARDLSSHGAGGAGGLHGHTGERGHGRRRQFRAHLPEWRHRVMARPYPCAMGDRRQCSPCWHARADRRVVRQAA